MRLDERDFWKRVLKLGDGEPMTEPSQWGYHLVEVRARGMSAEVDLVIPRPGAPHAMVTVHLDKEFNNYGVRSAKVWNVPVSVSCLTRSRAPIRK